MVALKKIDAHNMNLDITEFLLSVLGELGRKQPSAEAQFKVESPLRLTNPFEIWIGYVNPPHYWRLFMKVGFVCAFFDQDPARQMVSCIECYPHVVPESFREELRRFSRRMFNCNKVLFFSRQPSSPE